MGKKVLLVLVAVSLFFFIGCDETGSDASKVSVPQWLQGNWTPDKPMIPTQYSVYRFVEHDVLSALVEDGVIGGYSSTIVDEEFYTELASSDTNFNYKLEGLGIAEEIHHTKISATSCVRVTLRGGNETFRDTLSKQ